MPKEQYISYLPLSKTRNNISVLMFLLTFIIIPLIPSMRKGNYVIQAATSIVSGIPFQCFFKLRLKANWLLYIPQTRMFFFFFFFFSRMNHVTFPQSSILCKQSISFTINLSLFCSRYQHTCGQSANLYSKLNR